MCRQTGHVLFVRHHLAMQEEPTLAMQQGRATPHSMTPVSEERVPKSCKQIQQGSSEPDFGLFSILRILARNSADMVTWVGVLESRIGMCERVIEGTAVD